MRETILIIMSILAVLCFFKAGMCIDSKKPKGLLIIAVLFFICGISILINFTLLYQNDKLEKQDKKESLKYEKIENVYILKKLNHGKNN
jgi:uncharacterized membrane protein